METETQGGKVGPMVYHCLICESPNHKIYGYPRKQVAYEIFKENN
jgi:hypothetical protein